MQLFLTPLYNLPRQQDNFEWTTEQQKRFEDIKTLLTDQVLFQIRTNHFMLCATP